MSTHQLLEWYVFEPNDMQQTCYCMLLHADIDNTAGMLIPLLPMQAAISQFVGAAASAARPLDGLRQWQRTALRELGLEAPAGAELPTVHIAGPSGGC